MANLLLGFNQGLAWSSLQIMKIDLVNRNRRGFAMGANECAGYVAVAAAALSGGLLATAYGPRFALFAIPFPAVLVGLLLTIIFLRDIDGCVPPPVRTGEPFGRRFRRFRQLSLGTRSRFVTHLAGLVVNLKEGVAWGLLPLYFSARGLAAGEIAWLVALYPGVWGLTQLATGSLSDHWGRRPLVIGGLLAQAMSLVLFALLDGLTAWTCAAILLGLSTAATYPTLIAQASELTGVSLRAEAIGTYRLWRDLGYVRAPPGSICYSRFRPSGPLPRRNDELRGNIENAKFSPCRRAPDPRRASRARSSLQAANQTRYIPQSGQSPPEAGISEPAFSVRNSLDNPAERAYRSAGGNDVLLAHCIMPLWR